jgi:hypothetical protein
LWQKTAPGITAGLDKQYFRLLHYPSLKTIFKPLLVDVLQENIFLPIIYMGLIYVTLLINLLQYDYAI